MSESKYWQMVNDLVSEASTQGQPKHEIREEIINQVHAAYAAEERWALETLSRWEREGADGDYTKAHKALNGVTYIRRDGRRVRKTTSYSRPVRSEESGEIIGYQMEAWWDYSRARLVELRSDIAIQTGRLADVLRMIDLLIDAMDAHPECVTAREAWEAEGHTVTEIDLGAATA
jgi:hypothetical protein